MVPASMPSFEAIVFSPIYVEEQKETRLFQLSEQLKSRVSSTCEYCQTPVFGLGIAKLDKKFELADIWL